MTRTYPYQESYSEEDFDAAFTSVLEEYEAYEDSLSLRPLDFDAPTYLHDFEIAEYGEEYAY
jgi:hypothetical protein